MQGVRDSWRSGKRKEDEALKQRMGRKLETPPTRSYRGRVDAAEEGMTYQVLVSTVRRFILEAKRGLAASLTTMPKLLRALVTISLPRGEDLGQVQRALLRLRCCVCHERMRLRVAAPGVPCLGCQSLRLSRRPATAGGRGRAQCALRMRCRMCLGALPQNTWPVPTVDSRHQLPSRPPHASCNV